jgi:hypothetical protein
VFCGTTAEDTNSFLYAFTITLLNHWTARRVEVRGYDATRAEANERKGKKGQKMMVL